MNHDETNSNPGPKPDMHAWIEPELEARIVAWVAGEASAFEIAELERQIAEKPELTLFKRRIEAVHGLVGEAVLPETQPLRLSEDRRAKLLATIGSATPAAEAKVPAINPARGTSWWARHGAVLSFAGSGLAAAAVIAFLLTPRARFSEAELAKASAVSPAVVDEMKRYRVQSEAPASVVLALPPAQPAREGAAPESTDARVDQVRGLAPVAPPASMEPRREATELNALVSQRPAFPPPSSSEGPSLRTTGEPVRLADVAKDAQKVAGTGDAIVKLEPFTVAESREGSARAISTMAENAAPPLPALSPPSLDLTATTFADKPAATYGTTAAGAGPSESNASRPITLLKTPGTNAVESNRVGGEAPFITGQLKVADGVKGGPQGVSAPIAPASAAAPASTDLSRVGGSGTTSPASSLITSAQQKVQSQAVGAAAAEGRAAGAVAAASAAKTPETETITLSAFSVSAPAKKVAAAATKVGGAAGRARMGIFSPSTAVGRSERDRRPGETATNDVGAIGSREETSAAKEPVSTFSLHVSDASFRLAVAAVAAAGRGEDPVAPEIRVEEFYNAFDYGDPAPAMADRVGARIEQSVHPFLAQRNLLRIAMSVPSTGRTAAQPLRLTVLLDTSGSMEREDRRLAVRRALEELISLLGPNDRVTLIGFARQPRLLAEHVPGNQAGHLVELSARTPAEGGTNLEAALKLAGELALRHRAERAQNRIVVLTDGAANLGNADPERLAKSVETLRQQGIAFDACGIGLEGVGDAVLEALTRKGDGRYYVVDRPEAADAAFARQLAGAFRPAAENVKLQVRFNPARVGQYRLIGFDRHRLREQDFRDDRVDAAELAAEESATALYQVEVLPQGTGDVGEVFVRFRDAATGEMVERSWAIAHEPRPPRFDRASRSLQLAGVSALLAEKLGEGPLASQFQLRDFAGVVNALRGHYAHEPRVQELVTMFGAARRLLRE